MTTTQPAFGLGSLDPIDIKVTNRTGASVAAGDVVLVDHGRDAAGSTSNTPGLETSGLASIVDIADLGAGAARQCAYASGLWGVVQIGAADGFRTTVRLKGFVDSIRADAASNIATDVLTAPLAASPLAANVVASAGTNTADATARPKKIIAVLLVAHTGANDLKPCIFDGIAGFGTSLTTPG